ncbi:MAG: agmatinase [Ignavibacteriae bacterium HGW-Ignavibacteriae-4]|jgi:agmatinase|nr:MAG: agmatinase [Ignavibacteriae bacterium HGW-Ignavibacteriae-4]
MKILDIEKNFLALEEENSSFENSKVAIVSAPYEYTVSYGGGTKNGPEAIIKASQFVEFYDEEFDRELCFEQGICTVEPIDFGGKANKEALDLIYDQVKELLAKDKFVITLGGEHTISSAPIKAHHEKYPNMSVLQFDAHSDLRDTYEGSKYSHASIMARVAEFFPNDRITQVGIRAQCIEEANFIKENKVNTFYANAIRRGVHGKDWQQSVVDTLADEVYITFDVDYFDPSIMPATGTPEPDGFLYHETLDLLRKIKAAGKRVIGFDVVELAPMEGLSHPDILTASLIYKMLNIGY